MIIVISGTPGTGKSALAKKLMKSLNYPLLDINKFIKQKRLSEGYDKKRKTNLIDTKKLNKAIISEIKKVQKEPKNRIVNA